MSLFEEKIFRVIFYVPIVPEKGTPCPVALSCFHLFHLGVHNIRQLLSAFIPKIQYGNKHILVLPGIIICKRQLIVPCYNIFRFYRSTSKSIPRCLIKASQLKFERSNIQIIVPLPPANSLKNTYLTLFPCLHLYCLVLYSHAYTSTALYFIPMLIPLLSCTLFPCFHLYCLVLYSHAYASTALYFIPMLTPLLSCTLFPCFHFYCLVLYSHAYTSTALYPIKCFEILFTK